MLVVQEGMDANIVFLITEVPVPSGSQALGSKGWRIKGGHSGLDINLGRGNANKLLFRILKDAVKQA
jgi:dipeptidase D